MASSYSLPLLLLLIGILLFNNRCCQANELDLNNYTCAKNGIVQGELKAGDLGSSIEITKLFGPKDAKNLSFYALRMEHHSLNIRLSFLYRCTIYEMGPILEKDKALCNQYCDLVFSKAGEGIKFSTQFGSCIEAKEQPTKCRDNTTSECTSYTISCYIDQRPERIFKINVMLPRHNPFMECTFVGIIEGFRLLLENPDDPNGELCDPPTPPAPHFSFSTWIIVLMCVGGVVLLLAFVEIFAFVFLRKRLGKVGPIMTASTYFVSMIKSKSTAGPSTVMDPKGGATTGKWKTSYGAKGATQMGSTKGAYTNYTNAEIPKVGESTVGTATPTTTKGGSTAATQGTKPIGSNATATAKTQGTKTIGSTAAATTKTQGTMPIGSASGTTTTTGTTKQK